MCVLRLTSVNSEHDDQLKAVSGKNILLLLEFQGGINCFVCKVWVKQLTRKENPTEQNQTQKQETKPRRKEKINAALHTCTVKEDQFERDWEISQKPSCYLCK